MKLSSTQVKQTLRQMDAQVLPDDHPAVTQLTDVFGDHTFFLDSNGLNIIEPAVGEEEGGQAANVVKLASWNDAERTSLAAHEPQPTNVIIELGSEGRDSIH